MPWTQLTGSRRIWTTAYIGGEHLLLAFLRKPDDSDAGRMLAQKGVTWEQAGRTLMSQQRWRTRAPEGIHTPGLPSRRLQKAARAKAGHVKRLAYGSAHYGKPFMPYLLFPQRIADNPIPSTPACVVSRCTGTRRFINGS